MKTTLNFPDDLISQAKIRAAIEHTTLTSLITEGLRMRLKRVKPDRKLPVSAAVGGLLEGYKWEDIGREGEENEVYR